MADRRPRALGVRSRATIAAVVVVGVAAAAGTSALLTLTSERIESSIRDTAVARAEALGALISAGALEDPLPGLDPELFAQVVDASGSVVASDRTITGIPAVADIPTSPGSIETATLDDLIEGFEDEAAGLEDQGPYAVVALGVILDDAPVTVLVAASLEDAAQARSAVRPLLGIGLPLLLLLVGATVWVLTGLALRPVEKMSAEADRISALALDRRLPLPAARDELRRLASTLNEMLERLERSAIRQRRFVSDASHELKSPLASIRTIVDVAGSEGMIPTDAAADIGAEVERMQTLVTDLLFLARHDESPASMLADDVDLDQLALSVAGAVRGRNGVRIDTSGIHAARVRGDADRLEQLVRNVVDNAVRHAQSTVWVDLAEVDGEAILVVSDDGPGVPPDQADRVFERFVRLDESRARDTGGAGLGLAVARAIARDHGGDVVLGEPRHGGATFEVRLPT